MKVPGINALEKKKGESLTTLEKQQITEMQKSYGKNNVLNSIYYSKSAQMCDVAKMLMQHCGLRPIIGPSINSIIPDRSTAEKTWPADKFKIACRLGQATMSIEKDIDRMSRLILNKLSIILGENNITYPLVYAITGSIRKYGFELTRFAIDILPWSSLYPLETKILNFRVWLYYASNKEWGKAEFSLNKLGAHSRINYEFVPTPLSIRIYKYFSAKADRLPTKKEMEILWGLSHKLSIDEIIHMISCVPAKSFSIDNVLKLINQNKTYSRNYPQKNYLFLDNSNGAFYKSGDIIEVHLRDGDFWRIENFDGEFYTVSCADYDSYLEEYVFNDKIYYVPVSCEMIKEGRCVNNIPSSDSYKLDLYQRAGLWDKHTEDDWLEENTPSDRFNIGDERSQKESEYEAMNYDYSDFDWDGLDSDDFLYNQIQSL